MIQKGIGNDCYLRAKYTLINVRQFLLQLGKMEFHNFTIWEYFCPYVPFM